MFIGKDETGSPGQESSTQNTAEHTLLGHGSLVRTSELLFATHLPGADSAFGPTDSCCRLDSLVARGQLSLRHLMTFDARHGNIDMISECLRRENTCFTSLGTSSASSECYMIAVDGTGQGRSRNDNLQAHASSLSQWKELSTHTHWLLSGLHSVDAVIWARYTSLYPPPCLPPCPSY